MNSDSSRKDDEGCVKVSIVDVRNFNEGDEATSDVVVVQNLPWKLTVCRTSGRNLNVKLVCNEDSASNLWNCVATVDLTAKILKSAAEEFKIQSSSITETLSYTKNHVEMTLDSEAWQEPLPLGKLEIGANINLLRVFGVRKRKIIDCSVEQPILFNGILSIEGQKVHINKQLLTMHSKYFENLFFGKFAENTQEVVELPEVKHSEFCNFLDIIHPTSADIQNTTVENLLKLADRFQTEEVSARCEKFLIATEEVPVAKKLILAQQYRLGELMDCCLKSFNSMEDMLPLKSSEFYHSFNAEIKSTLLERLIKVHHE